MRQVWPCRQDFGAQRWRSPVCSTGVRRRQRERESTKDVGHIGVAPGRGVGECGEMAVDERQNRTADDAAQSRGAFVARAESADTEPVLLHLDRADKLEQTLMREDPAAE